MNQIAKRPAYPEDAHAAFMQAMWLLFLRCPADANPDEAGFYDLKEIGEARSGGKVRRWCPYSPCEGIE